MIVKHFCLLVLESPRKVGKVLLFFYPYLYENLIFIFRMIFIKNNPKDKKHTAVKYTVTTKIRLA